MYFNIGIPSVYWYVGEDKQDPVRCPLCGAAAADIQKTGRAGCAKCYEVFAELLDPYIRKIHGNVAHTGRVPGGGSPETKRSRELERLKRELKAAVDQEQYEKAASLRDRIRNVEAE